MKKICLILVVLLLSSSLFAIGFGYHIMEIKTTLDFGLGIFPTSMLYQFNFPVPDFISGCKTEFAFRLNNGLEYRSLRQNPDTGELFAKNPVSYPTEYSTLFDEFNLIFGQGFFSSSFSTSDILTLWASFDGRFENAYERLSWMQDKDSLQGLFWSVDPTTGARSERFPSSSWVGAPELAGDRSVFQTSITFGIESAYFKDEITRRNGVKFSSWFRLSKDWIPVNDNTADFCLTWNKLDLAYTLFSVKQNDDRNLSWISLVFDNSSIYRYINGTKVPSYVQGGNIWGTQAVNASSVLTNRMALTLYGPQINSRDSYLYATGFWDFGYSFGHVLNRSVFEKVSETTASVGFKTGFLIFNVAEVFYELGYVYDPVFEENKYFKQTFGFTLGV